MTSTEKSVRLDCMSLNRFKSRLAFRRLCCSAFFSIGDDGFLGITDALEDVTPCRTGERLKISSS